MGFFGVFSCLPQIAGMVLEHLIIIFPSLSSDNFYSRVNFNCMYWEALNSYANISLTGTILQWWKISAVSSGWQPALYLCCLSRRVSQGPFSLPGPDQSILPYTMLLSWQYEEIGEGLAGCYSVFPECLAQHLKSFPTKPMSKLSAKWFCSILVCVWFDKDNTRNSSCWIIDARFNDGRNYGLNWRFSVELVYE